MLLGVEWPGDCECGNINSMERFLSFLLKDADKVCGLDSHFQDSDFDWETSRFRNRNGDHSTVNLQTPCGVE